MGAEPVEQTGNAMTSPMSTTTSQAGGRPLRILLATDGSPSARSAEAWAAALRPAGEREVDVVAVAHEQSSWSWNAQTYRPQVRDAVAGLRESEVNQAQRVANAVAERLQADPDVVTRTWARSGDAVGQILALVAETAPDIVAIGHRGRSHLAELVLGSVARSIVEESPCAVLVARDPPAGAPAPGQAVLLVDSTPASARLAATVAELGILRGAEVLLLHVVNAPDAAPAFDRETALDALERVGVGVNALVEVLREAGAAATLQTAIGDPVDVAAAALAAGPAELLIVSKGTGHRAGSIEHRLLHEVRRSVLAVPVV